MPPLFYSLQSPCLALRRIFSGYDSSKSLIVGQLIRSRQFRQLFMPQLVMQPIYSPHTLHLNNLVSIFPLLGCVYRKIKINFQSRNSSLFLVFRQIKREGNEVIRRLPFFYANFNAWSVGPHCPPPSHRNYIV